MKHTLRWFKNHIGKRIYRDAVSCQCQTCTKVTKEGLIVRDDGHAEYLYNVQYELDVDYRDKK